MPQYQLSFRIDFYKDWDGQEEFIRPQTIADFSAQGIFAREHLDDAVRRVMYRSLGARLFSGAWAELLLDEANAEKLVAFFADIQRRGIGFPASGLLDEHATAEESLQCEWFQVEPRSCGCEFGERNGYPTCKAYLFPSHIHAQDRHYFSEQFRATVEMHALTGMEFLWVQDLGKYRARQWYAGVAAEAMGHGVDHPWFSFNAYRDNELGPRLQRRLEQVEAIAGPERLAQMKARRLGRICQEAEPVHRHGRNSFGRADIIESAIPDKTLRALVCSFPAKALGLEVTAPLRFRKAYVPQVDFAYTWDAPDAVPGTGLAMRSRGLCCSRRARDILVAVGMLSHQDLVPVITYETVPYPSEDLDLGVAHPPAMWTQEDMRQMRKIEAKAKSKYDSRLLPTRTPTLARSIGLLRSAKQLRPASFGKSVSASRIASVTREAAVLLPKSWLEVLSVANGGDFAAADRADCCVVPLEAVAQFHADQAELRHQDSDGYSSPLTHFASNSLGDAFAFEKEPASDLADAPVVLISHEDFSVVRSWGGVADFLESVFNND